MEILIDRKSNYKILFFTVIIEKSVRERFKLIKKYDKSKDNFNQHIYQSSFELIES